MWTRRSQRSIACLHRRNGNEPHPCGTACAGNAVRHKPRNKGKIVGQKAPFKLKDIWALRVRLQMERRATGIDSNRMSASAATGVDRALWPLALLAGLLPLAATAIAYLLSIRLGLVPECNPFTEGCVSI